MFNRLKFTNFVGRSFDCLFVSWGRCGIVCLAFLFLSGCSSYTCPTYSMAINNQEVKFSKKGNNINRPITWVFVGGFVGWAVVSNIK